MDSAQYIKILDNLSDIKASQQRIEQKIESHIDEDRSVHNKQDNALSELYTKTSRNTTSIARIKGIGAGIGGVFTFLLAIFGIDSL